MPAKSIVAVDYDQLYNLYESALTFEEIAKRLNISTHSLLRIRINLRMPRRAVRKGAAIRERLDIDEQEEEEITPEMLQQRIAFIQATWTPDDYIKRDVRNKCNKSTIVTMSSSVSINGMPIINTYRQ